MSRTFLDASIPDLVASLKVEEKISLLGAPNWWNTTSIERLAIPAIRMSDGPNGVRGSSHFVSTPAQCLPCATSLASTFDPELVHEVGVFLGKEAKTKSSVVLLAPTCNIQRTPLGGRSFESFSEDPHLSGILAAAYVNGLQSEGVSATIKHFVANDQEHERTAADSVMSARALREVYLYPFMLAQRDAKPGALMTSYGRIEGVHCSENKMLLTGILRDEWKFEGIVISDWFGTYSVDQSINAGMDLEMPGPPRWRTSQLVLHCLSSQKLRLRNIDERVTNLLTFVQKQARRNPEIVYGDGVERTRDTPEGRQFSRKLAADGIVILKNKDNLLPFSVSKVKRLAVIGPNAKERIISGGGSAALKPIYVVTPFEGVLGGAPEGMSVEYEVGCYAHKYLPTLENSLVTPAGEMGWLCTFYSHNADGSLSDPMETFILSDTRVKLNDFLPKGLTTTWTIRLEGKLTIDTTGPFELGLTVAGRAKLWINGRLTIDNWTKQTPGDFFYGQGTVEEKATIDVTANVSLDVLVEYTNTSPPDGTDEKGEGRLSQPALMRGVRLGGCHKIDPEEAIQAAVSLAAKSDAVLYVGGLSPEWESEGFDRPTLQMPGRQDEVIQRLAEANSNTIVAIQAGSAVSMPWVDSVAGIVQAWYLGNEAGNAIADVLYGVVNPAGRLPLTLPVHAEDIPAHLNDRSENGKIHYREDLFVGYKYYQARNVKPLFPFGFGLSYTTFYLCDLSVQETSSCGVGFGLEISVTIKNVGPVTGSEVVQLYVSYPDIGLATPKLQLKGFGKAKDVKPGATRTVSIKLNRYSVSFWDTERNSWHAAAGQYGLHIGRNSVDLPLQTTYNLQKDFFWTGL
ncbi:glycoside hydrolase family 3 protein [Lyophyllum atratum]|nr:glycoside hydrolase family 3 protein [Lyophyllum atratum]